MVDQETVASHNGSPAAQSKAAAKGIAELAHDVTTLAELQAKLFSADLSDSLSRVKAPAVLVIVGVAAVLGCAPVLLAALASGLVALFGWAYGWALLAAGLVGLVASGGMLFAAWRLGKEVFRTFRRSTEELDRNVQWLKGALRHKAAHEHEKREETSTP